MDLAARSDALDDLLAEIAAFAEVEGAGLVGFLREVFGRVGVADVGAVAGGAFEDAEGFEGRGSAGIAPACVRAVVRMAMVAGAAQSSKWGMRGLWAAITSSA